MGIPEKSALAILAVIVTSVVTCALFVCREMPGVRDALCPRAPATQQPLSTPPPAMVQADGDPALTRARPGPGEDLVEPPDTQRWYRRRGLAPNWTMRTREPLLGRGGAQVRREALPELKVDLVEPEIVDPPLLEPVILEDDPAPANAPAEPDVR